MGIKKLETAEETEAAMKTRLMKSIDIAHYDKMGYSVTVRCYKEVEGFQLMID